MALKVERLQLTNWRNMAERTIELDPSLTLLVGPNASGKTNTIEALALLTRGSSFRHARAIDQVREGAERGRAEARLTGEGRVLDVALEVSDEGRRFTRNGKAASPGSIAGTLLSILFSPDDLLLVKGSAGGRRDELDGFGSQASKVYRKVARTYHRSVEQRNRLLKDPSVDVGLLDVWDESVARGAATLTMHRLSLLRKLTPLWEEAYRSISGGEVLAVRYETSLGEVSADETKEELFERYSTAFQRGREEDLRRGLTLIGPHRDDIDLLVEGRAARRFASQGQQRSLVLAWKLAQVRFSEQVLGERPMLLLDDVLSELDESRRHAITHLVDEGIQTVITTAHEGYVDPEELARAKVVSYGDR